ncbi:MAG: hypothetical protein ACLTDF_10650 [Coprococcus sp.]
MVQISESRAKVSQVSMAVRERSYSYDSGGSSFNFQRQEYNLYSSEPIHSHRQPLVELIKINTIEGEVDYNTTWNTDRYISS